MIIKIREDVIALKPENETEKYFLALGFGNPLPSDQRGYIHLSKVSELAIYQEKDNSIEIHVRPTWWNYDD